MSQAITTVTWTAVAGGIPANDFDEFALSVGRLPDGVDSLSFPAVQTYSDGEVVKWDQPKKDGADEPEHPTPTLKLVTETIPLAATTADRNSSADPLARILGATGLVLGLIGLGLGVRSPKTQPQPAAIPTGSAPATSTPASSASAGLELAGPGGAGSGEFGKAQSLLCVG